LKTLYNLFIKDLRRFINDKPALIMTFAVPMALIVIFGNIFGGGGSRGKINIILVNQNNSAVSQVIEKKLDNSKNLRMIKRYISKENNDTLFFDETSAIRSVREGNYPAAIVMPEDFFTDTSSSLKFKFYYDPKNEFETSIIQGTIQQTIMTQITSVLPVLMQRQSGKLLGQDSSKQFIEGLGNIVSEYFDFSADSFLTSITEIDTAKLLNSEKDSTASGNIFSNLIKFESEQVVGKEVSNPGLTRTVGGWAMMFLLFSLTGASTSLFEEKNEGTLKRLLCMPVTKVQILISKYIYTMLLGIVQLLTLFIFAWIIFDVDIFSNFINLFVIIVISSFAAVAFGMLITSLASSLNQASGMSTLIILVMSALGGSWFPVTLLPEWMQILSKGTITYWSVEAFLNVLWRQSSLIDLSLHIIILLSIGVFVNMYSVYRFKNGTIL